MLKLKQNLLFRIFIITCLPLAFVLYGLWEVIQLKTLDKLNKDKAMAYEGLKKLESANEPEDFLGIKILNAFTVSLDAKSLNTRIKNIHAQTGIGLKYLIWTQKNKVKFSNFANSTKNEALKKACQLIYDCHVLGRNKRGQSISKVDTENFKLVFGPHFIFGNMNIIRRTNLLLKTDSGDNSPRLWIKTKPEYTLIIFINPALLKSKHINKAMLKNLEKTNNSVRYAIANKNGIICSQNSVQTIISKAFPNPFNITELEKNYKNHLIISNYIDDKTTEFAIIAIPRNKNIKRFVRVSFVIITLTFILIFWIYRTFFIAQSDQSRMLLQNKFLVFFILFNIIPTTIFVLLSYNYLSQLKKTEISRIYTKGTRFLEHIDSLFLSESTHQIRKLTKSVDTIRPDLEKNCITASNVTDLVGSQSPPPLRFTIVGSTTTRFATENGIYDGKKEITKLNIPHVETRSYKDFVHFSEVMKLLGKLFLTTINRIPIKPLTSTKYELTAEALGQGDPTALVQAFYKSNGMISNFGFGEAYSPVFSYAFSILNTKLMDYCFIYSWDAWSLPIHYITRLFKAFNKNEIGLKVMVTIDDRKIKFPSQLNNHEELVKYGLNLNESSNDNQVKICSWQGNDYYFMGYKGLNAKPVNYIGLYPCKKVDSKIYEQQVFFVSFGLVGFLISVLFGLSISREIMAPISHLKIGINALKNKNYSFRIEDIGNNEFGNLARIINETNADQEEIYQTDNFSSKLFVNTGNEIEIGNAKIYGQASAFCDLGKDYLDIFILKAPYKVGILWGQIEKIGIASTLLAAFIKSSTIIYQDLENNPMLFVEKISRLVNRINEKENKLTISFQYMLIDTQVNMLELANCGCHLPIIVNNSTGIIKKCIIGKQQLETGDTLIAHSPKFLDMESFANHLNKRAINSPKEHYEAIVNDLATSNKLPIDIFNDSSMVILKIS